MLYLAHQAMALCMWMLERLDTLPLSVWTQHAPPTWTIASGVLGALWILAPRGIPLRFLGILFLLPMFLVAPATPAENTARIIVFDVGQGLAVAVQTRNHAMLYDTGPDFAGESDSGNRILAPSLRGLGIDKLDGLMLSHDDIDHIGGTNSVMQALPIEWVSSSLKTGHPLLGTAKRHTSCTDGQSWTWDGVRFEVLHPSDLDDPDKKHDNDQSCVLRISVGTRSILLVGDIEKASESRLLALHMHDLPSTLLVAPHHGSKSSSSEAFVSAVSPHYVVFTSGYRNRFHHPHPDVWQRYGEMGAERLRSDTDGAILIELNADELKVESYRKAHRRYWTHEPESN
jgi:competence protein ComEC